jgi:restriction system protein
MYQKHILDNLNGFEFEELMADVFRKKGFKNVEVTQRTNDGGKDIIMDEVTPSGEVIKVLVECKHHKSGVGRPVVQKFHSAVSTLEFPGKKKGYIVSSGTFTESAIEAVQVINNQHNNLKLELIDGKKLKEIACDLGLDLQNGIIEAISNKSLCYSSEAVIKTKTLEANIYNVNNISKDQVTIQDLNITFYPIYYFKYKIDAQFATTVGVIHKEERDSELVIDGMTANRLKDEYTNFLLRNINQEKQITVGECRQYKLDFKKNEKELKNKAILEIIDSHKKTVNYTGKNNITYQKTCVPNSKDISIHDCRTLYYPQWTINIKAKQKTYVVSFIESAGDVLPVKNDTIICQICNRKNEKSRWYCTFCGSIICESHLKVTRLDKVKICTNCSIAKSFFGAKKYFQSNDELKAFESYYASLPLYKKIWENSYLVYSILIILILSGLRFISSVT